MIDWEIGAHFNLPLWYHLAAFIGEGDHAVPYQSDRGVLRVHAEGNGFVVIWQSRDNKVGVHVCQKGVRGVMTEMPIRPSEEAQSRTVKLIGQRLLAAAAKEAKG